MIVDTDVLIHLMQGNEQATRKIAALENQHVPLHISSITQFELYHSLERVDDTSNRRRQIEAVLDSKPVYSADSPVMKKAGRLDGRLTANGNAIGIGDTIIAATALVHEESVLTKNVAHFERIDGLEIDSF